MPVPLDVPHRSRVLDAPHDPRIVAAPHRVRPRPRRAASARLGLVLLVALVPVLLPLLGAGVATADPAPAPDGSRVGVTAGRWQWPLAPPPPVVRGFDPPAQRWAAGHRGVDLLATPGAAVLAAADGVVAFSGSVAGRPVVAVQHGPLRTTYEPVAGSVRVGQRVAGGAPLGRLVLGGSHCLPRACLHWGLRRGRDYLDPLRLVRRGPPRLLPWWDGSADRAGSAGGPAHSAGALAVSAGGSAGLAGGPAAGVVSSGPDGVGTGTTASPSPTARPATGPPSNAGRDATPQAAAVALGALAGGAGATALALRGLRRRADGLMLSWPAP